MGTLDTYKHIVEGSVSEISATSPSSGTYELRLNASVGRKERNRIYAAYLTGLSPAEYEDTFHFYLNSQSNTNHNFHITLYHIPTGNLSDIYSDGVQLKDWGQPTAGQTLSYDISGDTSSDGTVAVVNEGTHYYSEDDYLYFTFSNLNQAIEVPSSPNNQSLEYINDDEMQLSFDAPSDWGGETGSYEVQINRDGSGYSDPSGGPKTPSSAGTYSYGPNSDTAYGRQIGIDSSFRFRVRANNSAGSSSWSYTSTVYTTPIPPHNPSVSRPDANTVEISWTNVSDVYGQVRIDYREDTGSGYGSWNFLKSGNFGGSTSVSTSGDLSEDARYQFKLQSEKNNSNNNSIRSPYVYADYGNNGNVYFEDDFESGDLSAWADTNISDAQSGIQSGSMGDLGISGADQGTYYCRLDSGDWIRTGDMNLGSETEVLVRATIAAGSMDNSSERGRIEIYDNSTSSYVEFETFYREYNKQGWVQVCALIPSNYLDGGDYIRFRSDGGGGDHFAVDRVVVSDVLHEYTKPTAPSGLSLDSSVAGEIGATWTSNDAFGDYHNVDLILDGSFQNTNYPSQTSTTHSGLADAEEYQIEVDVDKRQHRHGSLDQHFRSASVSSYATTKILTPNIDSLSVVSNDQIDLDFSDPNNANDAMSYSVDIQRDSGSWRTPSMNSNPSSPGSYSYTSDSDSDYGTFVGIDSSFQFRVNASNTHGSSSYEYTSEVYTDPIPPHNPSVSRPDANTVEVTYTVQSDQTTKSVIFYRKDTGGGYGGWSWVGKVDNHGRDATGQTRTQTLSTTNESWMDEDSRYQFKIRSENADASARLDSEFVYCDYGNEGNVFFEDDFNSGNLSAWDTTSLSDLDSQVTSGSSPYGSVSGPDEGSYHLRLDGSDYIEKNLGDLSSETDVLVKAAVAVESMDSDGNWLRVQWYDGNSWSQLPGGFYSTSYNRQGWVEFQSLVPDSDLSTDNRLRVIVNNGGGDYHFIDRVVVSDVLHEYTQPAAPTNLALDASVNREITASWTSNTSIRGDTEWHSKAWVRLNGSTQDQIFGESGATYSGALDGEQYDLEAATMRSQDRRGSHTDWLQSSTITGSATTNFPTPSNFSIDGVDGDAFLVSWSGDHNNGTAEIKISANGGSSFVTGNSTPATNNSMQTGEWDSANSHVLKVRAFTDHASVESSTDSASLSGSVSRHIEGGLETEYPGVVFTEK